MRNFILLLIIFFSCLSKIIAQTDNTAPTKEDAVNFISKVFNEYGFKTHNEVFPEWTNTHVDVVLDGCTLKFLFTAELQDKLEIDSSFYEIQLPEVKLEETDKKLIALSKKAILINKWQCQRKKTSGKYKLRYAPWSPRTYEPEFIYLSNFHDENTAGPDDFNFMLFALGESPSYTANNYTKRLYKAFQFLIKACGGGRVRADSNDKF